ncbi:hypothetical protein C9374_011023 [Naegleria lovaniensis]|uniref:Uncharacterized protein n=1 Tax=Naegleria lovaniensis TaxID=51637 RepID=A0AA88GCW2_NAELO|nr:uncharacterized protein C9374_011023 [Naegleria lovaniensis]KAG2374186.1 hypothetical protein C9374_011023 [Naegleria lovaniensis]
MSSPSASEPSGVGNEKPHPSTNQNHDRISKLSIRPSNSLLPPILRYFVQGTFRWQVHEKWSLLSWRAFFKEYRYEIVTGLFSLIGSTLSFVNWNWMTSGIAVSWNIDLEQDSISFQVKKSFNDLTRDEAVQTLRQLNYVSQDVPIGSNNILVLNDREIEITLRRQSHPYLVNFVEQRDEEFKDNMKKSAYFTIVVVLVVNWIRSRIK